jgi:hypothetical protein
LLTFLQQHDIGMQAWALDVLDSLIADWRFTPTSLDGFQCGEGFSQGPGELVKARMPGWVPHVSRCETGLSDEGVVAIPVDIPDTGEYRLWSRVMKATGAADSGVGRVQIDDGCPITAGGDVPPTGAWSWQSSPEALLRLEAGRHTIRFLGSPGGVNLDRVVLTADEDCVPGYPTESCIG